MRSIRTLVVLLAVALTAPALATAAKPRSYTGLIKQTSTSLLKRVRLTIKPRAKTGLFSFRCGTGRAPQALRVKISHGSFSGTRRTGSVKLWSVSGHFTSAKRATARLRLYAVCDAHGGKVVLKRKS